MRLPASILVAISIPLSIGCAPAVTTFQTVDKSSGQPLAGVRIIVMEQTGGFGTGLPAVTVLKCAGATGADGRITMRHGWDDLVQFGKRGFRIMRVHVHDGSATFLRGDFFLEPGGEIGHEPLPSAGPLTVRLEPGQDATDRLLQDYCDLFKRLMTQAIASDPKLLQMSDEAFITAEGKSFRAFGLQGGCECLSSFWLDVLHDAQRKAGVGAKSPPANTGLTTPEDAHSEPNAATTVSAPPSTLRDIQKQADTFEARALLNEASKARQANDYAGARDLYIRAITLDPANATAVRGRDEMLTCLGQTPDGTERSGFGFMGPDMTVLEFGTALSDLDSDLARGDLAGAEFAYMKAHGALPSNQGIYTLAQIRKASSRLAESRRRIDAARKARGLPVPRTRPEGDGF